MALLVICPSDRLIDLRGAATRTTAKRCGPQLISLRLILHRPIASGSTSHSASVVAIRAHSVPLSACSKTGATTHALDVVEERERHERRAAQRHGEGEHDRRHRGEQPRADGDAVRSDPRRRAPRRARVENRVQIALLVQDAAAS
jgi:hypothetical protein